jgi:hypothetical protein
MDVNVNTNSNEQWSIGAVIFKPYSEARGAAQTLRANYPFVPLYTPNPTTKKKKNDI